MRLFLLVSLLALPAGAAWQRHVMTPKEFWVDTPDTHSLAYFTEDPVSRCEQCDYCWSCSSEERLAESKKIKTDLTLVGKLAGFEIYDLYYHFGAERRTDTKLILVKTGADRFREIYQCSPTAFWGTGAVPSVLIRIGDDQFLEAKYDAGVRSNVRGERAPDLYDYFWFDKTGATLVDFRPILLAAQSLLPTGAPFQWTGDLASAGVNYLWHFNEPLRSHVGVGEGTATIEFKFDHGRVVVTRALYKPGAAASR